jgi:hypothetical protein
MTLRLRAAASCPVASQGDPNRSQRTFLTARSLRRALGAVWVLDALLQAQPALFGADWWRTQLAQSAMGQPREVNRSILWAVGVISAHAALWNSAFVLVQAVIGISLLVGRWERLAIAASVPWALGIWWVGEGFGNLLSGFAITATGAPGAVLLYALLGLVAWPRQDRRDVLVGPARWAWVAFWTGGAALLIPWQFPVHQVLSANVEELSQGVASWQAPTAHAMGQLVADHALAVAAVMAAAQVASGIGLLWEKTTMPALALGMALALAYWWGFEYLGGIPAGGATDPNSGPLVILLALALWPCTKPARHDADRQVPERAAVSLGRSDVALQGS